MPMKTPVVPWKDLNKLVCGGFIDRWRKKYQGGLPITEAVVNELNENGYWLDEHVCRLILLKGVPVRTANILVQIVCRRECFKPLRQLSTDDIFTSCGTCDGELKLLLFAYRYVKEKNHKQKLAGAILWHHMDNDMTEFSPEEYLKLIRSLYA